METGYKMCSNRGEIAKNNCVKLCARMWEELLKTRELSIVCGDTADFGLNHVDRLPQVFNTYSTNSPQVLHIETLPDIVDLFTNHHIEFALFGDFVNRVHGGGVVFSSKLFGDDGKTEFQLAPE